MIADTLEYYGDADDSTSYTTSPNRTILKRKRVTGLDGEDEGIEVRVRPQPVPGAGAEEVGAEDIDDDEDGSYMNDPPRVGCQVLPVADLPEDFAGEPQDGLEYLFTVRLV